MAAANNRKRAVETTADWLRAEILRGRLPAGSALPGERALAAQLGVSRLTLRSAIARPETEGLLRSVHGSGTRVLDFRESGGVDLLGYLASQQLAGGTVPVELLADLLELRRMVAVDLLGFVTERATDDELAELRDHVRKQAKLLDDPERYIQADLHFARLLVRAGRNLALELLYNTVVRLVANNPGFQMAFQTNAPQAVMVYERVVELMGDREPKRVMRIAGRVLDRLDHATLARIRAFIGEESADEDEATSAGANDGEAAAAANDMQPGPRGARRED